MNQTKRLLVASFLSAGPLFLFAQNVGIGTLTPTDAKLQVQNAGTSTLGMFTDGSTGFSVISELGRTGLGFNMYYTGGAYKFKGNGYGGLFYYLPEDGRLSYYSSTALGTSGGPVIFSQLMSVEANGNVGIGTVNALARLEVKGAATSSTTNAFMIRNSNGDTLMRVRNDGKVGIGYNGNNYGRLLNIGGAGINFYTANEAAFGGAIFPTDTSLVIWSNSNANNYVILQPSWGNTGIGTYTPNAKLHLNGSMLIGNNAARIATGYVLSVDGKIICEELKVQNSTAWPDYVFEKDYKMPELHLLEKQVMQDKHLPGVPSANEIESAKGFEMGAIQQKMLEKLEELYRYTFELNKENLALKKEMAEVKTQFKELQAQVKRN